MQAVSYGLPCVPPALSDFCGKKRDAFQCKKNSPINEQTQNQKIYCQRTRKENILILKSIDAVGKLTYADAIAIRDGKTNGEMKAAIEAYKKADEELYNFLLEQNAMK